MTQPIYLPVFRSVPQRKILIAEDNLINQKVASRLLSLLGYQSDIATNGAEAITMLVQGEYAAILMDLQMPVMDGLEATRAIRSMPGPNSVIPIIALTANVLSNERDRCIAAGMNDFLCKPIETEKFAAALQRWAEPKAFV